MGHKASAPRIQLEMNTRAAMLARPRYRIAGNPAGELRIKGVGVGWARRRGEVAKRLMGKAVSEAEERTGVPVPGFAQIAQGTFTFIS